MATQTTTLVILAAGSSSRFGGNKQLAPVGPDHQALLDYTIYDAVVADFEQVVLVTSETLETNVSGHAAHMNWDIPIQIVVQPSPSGTLRSKPWGTGHAVLAAREAVSGPFVVCNADDFYGRPAFARARQHLIAPSQAEIPDHALLTYQLASTLNETGGVSRGICDVVDGRVTNIAEVNEIRCVDRTITGRSADNSIVHFSGQEPISMNLWAFGSEVFLALSTQFDEFQDEWADDQTREFYLSEAIGAQIHRRDATLTCIPCPDDWFGMTFAPDLSGVRRRIKRLVNSGVYRWG